MAPRRYPTTMQQITLPVACHPGALPTLRQFKLAYARWVVQRTGSQGRAADVLGITQPQISRLVKEAEKEAQKWDKSPSR